MDNESLGSIDMAPRPFSPQAHRGCAFIPDPAGAALWGGPGAASSTCEVQQRLLMRETALRAQAKSSPRFETGVELAQFALQVQRERYKHIETCDLCLRLESGVAA